MENNAKFSTTVERRTVDSIRTPHSLREPRDISSLAKNIARVGLLNPIVITKDGDLIAGRRRLEACSLLGWTEIPCLISLNYSDLERELAQLSENLHRDNGTKFQQARWLARMKVIYEELYPETKRGGTPAKSGGGKKRVSKNDKMSSFVKDTAKKIRKSPRSIERQIRVAKELETLADKIFPSPIADSHVELEKLVEIKDKGIREKVLDSLILNPILNVEGALKEVKKEERAEQIDTNKDAAETMSPERRARVGLLSGDFEQVCENNLVQDPPISFSSSFLHRVKISPEFAIS